MVRIFSAGKNDRCKQLSGRTVLAIAQAKHGTTVRAVAAGALPAVRAIGSYPIRSGRPCGGDCLPPTCLGGECLSCRLIVVRMPGLLIPSVTAHLLDNRQLCFRWASPSRATGLTQDFAILRRHGLRRSITARRRGMSVETILVGRILELPPWNGIGVAKHSQERSCSQSVRNRLYRLPFRRRNVDYVDRLDRSGRIHR